MFEASYVARSAGQTVGDGFAIPGQRFLGITVDTETEFVRNRNKLIPIRIMSRMVLRTFLSNYSYLAQGQNRMVRHVRER